MQEVEFGRIVIFLEEAAAVLAVDVTTPATDDRFNDSKRKLQLAQSGIKFPPLVEAS